MTDLSRATPRPWQIHQSFPFEVCAGDFVLAKCQMPNPLVDIDEASANAALIVQVVNERDELIACLRGFIERARASAGDFSETWPEMKAARRALAKVDVPQNLRDPR